MTDMRDFDPAKYYAEHPELRRSAVGSGNLLVTPALPSGVKAQTQNKFHVSPKEDRTYNGRLYASKKEASKAQELDLLVRAGDIDFYLEQVPFRLPGRTKHLVDFVTFERVANTTMFDVQLIEVKGRDEALGKVKRRQVEELYHVTITVV